MKRWTATGYPRSISGNLFHEFAQVCAVANLYDHLVCNEQLPPHEALEVIMGQNGRTYSQEVISAFVKAVPIYPPGMKVCLLDGSEAIVSRIEHTYAAAVYSLYGNG